MVEPTFLTIYVKSADKLYVAWAPPIFFIDESVNSLCRFLGCERADILYRIMPQSKLGINECWVSRLKRDKELIIEVDIGESVDGVISS